MGADGGTIPTRDELVKVRKRPEKKDKNADLAHKWNDCAITQLPLIKPVMACEYGTLYNKESILEMLLDKDKIENCANFTHIRNLKDVKELNLTDNKAFTKIAQKGDSYHDLGISPYSCPVTGLEMNGKHRFCFIWSCGCVMAERALKEVPSSNCHKCGKTFRSEDVIVLNGDDEDFVLMKQRMEERRAAAKLLKKAQKKSKISSEMQSTPDVPSSKKHKLDTEPASVDKKKTKGLLSDKPAKTRGSASVESKETGNVEKKFKSIQEDPNVSKTLKSLFTSSEEAKKQPKPHAGWITFNPQYFR